MRVRDIFLNGIGVYLPPGQTVASFVERGLVEAGRVDDIGFRAVAVAGDMPAPEMALRAARDAVRACGLSAAEFRLLLYADCWHQGPHGWEPQHYLRRLLPADDLLAVEIKHGCGGMFSAIQLAAGYLRADERHRAALVVASDNFGTPLAKRWAAGVGLVPLGDGASAVVLSRDQGFARLLSVCTATYSEMEEGQRLGEQMFPPGITVGRGLNFTAAHDAFDATMSAGARAIMAINHVHRNIECADRALAEAEVGHGDIKRVVVHNMPEEEARTYLGVLGFTPEQSTWAFGRDIGHVGTSDQMISLYQLMMTAQLQPGDHVLLCGLAPGATYKAAVVKIVAIPSWAR